MTSANTSARRNPQRLGIRTRRAALITHIAAAGSWLGVDVAMAVLIVTALTTEVPATRAMCLQALEVVTVWPLLTCGLICLGTGVLLGLGSRWGVVRYWWVAIKLVVNLVLSALVLVSLRGEVAEQADRARQSLDSDPVSFDMTNLVYPPTVSPTLLLVAIALSVVKPWGQTRRRAVEHNR